MKWYHKLIPFNWMLSLLGVMGINEHNSDTVWLILLIWFSVSSLILMHADSKGWITRKDKK